MLHQDAHINSIAITSATYSGFLDLATPVGTSPCVVTLGPFRVFGGKDPGLKVNDLINDAEAIEKAGLRLNGCPVLAVEQFFRFMELTGYDSDTPVQKVLETPFPEEFSCILQQILTEAPVMAPLAIRSTACSERGGLGIYESTFLLLTGDMEQDLPAFWEALMEVYASEFSGNAAAWRAKINGEMGIAVMFHPVVGAWHGDYFFPLIAGRGYTSSNGEPLLRLVAGIATEEALASMGAFSSAPRSGDFERDVRESQKTIWAVDKETRRLAAVSLSEWEEGWEILERISRFYIAGLFDELDALKCAASGERYVEFAIAKDDHSDMEVVQCAPVEDKKLEPLVVDVSGLTEISRSEDIVNHGVRRGRGVIWLGRYGWRGGELDEMEHLNRSLAGFAVFVRENEFSQLSRIFSIGLSGRGECFGYRHFSNAGLVCERQFSRSEAEKEMQWLTGIPVPDHSQGKGGTHFVQLCQRSDILFQGAQFDETPLPVLPGGMCYSEGNVMLWDVEWVAVNDVTKGEGVFYIKGEPCVQEYDPKDIEHYADVCYQSGGEYERLSEDETEPKAGHEAGSKEDCAHRELSHAFYDVCFILPVGVSPMGFDPFQIQESAILKIGGKAKALQAIDLVLKANSDIPVGDDGLDCVFLEEGEEGPRKSFGDYLAKLRNCIEAWEARKE